jgi:carbon monoxide dehydrogenase subunit G
VQIRNEFRVPTAPAETWAWLLDVERIAPCLPGAEITEQVDDRTWKGKVTVKFGPVVMAFAGQVTIDDRDDERHRVKLVARGTEQKGKGAANAVVTSWLEPDAEGGTQVKMEADITLSGAVAQLSRGLLPEVSRQLTGQFAACLEASMASAAPVGAEATPGSGSTEPSPSATVGPRPVGGLGLGLRALWATIVGAVRRLVGSRRRP